MLFEKSLARSLACDGASLCPPGIAGLLSAAPSLQNPGRVTRSRFQDGDGKLQRVSLNSKSSHSPASHCVPLCCRENEKLIARF